MKIGIIETILSHHRIVVLSAAMLSLIGIAMWRVMPRQEDPELVVRWGAVSVDFPGADPETVERLVLEPLENALSEVEEIRFLDARASEGFGLISLLLKDSVSASEVDARWKDIEDAVARARTELPAGSNAPRIDRGLADLEVIVLAVTGSPDPLVLRRAALDIRDELLDVPAVARIKVTGDPGEEVVVAFDAEQEVSTEYSREALAAHLRSHHDTVPAGALTAGERRATLTAQADPPTLDTIRETPIPLRDGTSVSLGAVARVTHGPASPLPESMRWEGKRAVGLGIVAQEGGNVVALGNEVRARLDDLRAAVAPLQIHEVTFQPARVEARISELGSSLLWSIAIVGVLVVATMGVRMGLVVTVVVPLVVLTSVAIYAMFGGVLHQMSIAALVIGLGMLVDNAIVVVEGMIRRIEDGDEPWSAASAIAQELAVPLFTATGTTIAAFVPMMLAQGAVGEFTRAIPLLVALVLFVSYVYGIVVTPVLGQWVLRPRPPRPPGWFDDVTLAIGVLSVRYRRLVFTGVLALVVLVTLLGGRLKQSFFPGSDRNEVLVTLELPEGSKIEAIDTAAAILEQRLAGHPHVEHIATFVGRSAPHFYYNVPTIVRSPHLAQILVTTDDTTNNAAVEAFVREEAHLNLPGVGVVAASLEQGPGAVAPIEVRVRGKHLDEVRRVTRDIGAILERIDGTRSVRDTASLGVPQVSLEVHESAAAAHNLSRSEVARTLWGLTRGFDAGSLYTEHGAIPIRVRSSAGETTPADELAGIMVSIPGGSVPLAQLVRTELRWRPAQIVRRDRKRVATVLANLDPGTSYSTVMDALRRELPSLEVPPTVHVSFGGDAEGAGDANAAMAAALPAGVLLLLGFLMLEFNSFRRVLLVLTTVPLAAVGVIPGLLIGGQPFGFMSLLGVVALAGVVVNNAIILIDVIEQRRREGASVSEALAASVALRIRPILLTSATTIVGLVPLALSGTSLWPPLAWAMISGLGASTVLTLVFVPAAYSLVFDRTRCN